MEGVGEKRERMVAMTRFQRYVDEMQKRRHTILICRLSGQTDYIKTGSINESRKASVTPFNSLRSQRL